MGILSKLKSTGSPGQVLTKIGRNGFAWRDSSGGSAYTLPPATPFSLGGVIVGANLIVNEYGVLSAVDQGGTTPTLYTQTSQNSQPLNANDIVFPTINVGMQWIPTWRNGYDEETITLTEYLNDGTTSTTNVTVSSLLNSMTNYIVQQDPSTTSLHIRATDYSMKAEYYVELGFNDTTCQSITLVYKKYDSNNHSHIFGRKQIYDSENGVVDLQYCNLTKLLIS